MYTVLLWSVFRYVSNALPQTHPNDGRALALDPERIHSEPAQGGVPAMTARGPGHHLATVLGPATGSHTYTTKQTIQ